MAEKEYKEIDVSSLDSELAAVKTLEESKGDKFIKIASIVVFCMTLSHIYTGFHGLFGNTMSVSTTVIFMFVMFGAFLESSGCSDFINKIAISLTGKVKSGPTLSAVMGSGALLMVSFTETKYINIVIPAMVKSAFSSMSIVIGCACAGIVVGMVSLTGIGVTIMSAGFQGWLLWKLNIVERIVFIAGGLLMFLPGNLTDITGLVIVAVMLLINVKKWKKAKVA